MRRLYPLVLLVVLGCATTTDTYVAPGYSGRVTTVLVETRGGRSSDVDSYLQRAFLHNGFTVQTASDSPADLIVRYSDDWGWDMAMYLKSIDVNVYDAQSNALVATARWRNSTLHGFHGTDKTIQRLVADLSAKLRKPSDGSSH